jgi:RNA polymerase sigma-70 factor (ECF subfamily)
MLVQLILKKDPAAQQYLYETYRPKLHRFTTYFLGYRDGDIEDVVQESFLAAFDHLHEFEFRSSLSHWLYRICVHRCYERIRQRKRQLTSLDEELEVFARGMAVQHPFDQEEEGAEHGHREFLSRVRGTMDVFCRKILELRDQDGRSYAKIADALKIPIGTVMSRLSRCKEVFTRRAKKAARKEGMIHE